VFAVLGVIKPCTRSYTRTLRYLMPRSCAYLDSLGEFGFGLNRASKTNVGFGLVISGRVRASIWDPFTILCWFAVCIFPFSQLTEEKHIISRILCSEPCKLHQSLNLLPLSNAVAFNLWVHWLTKNAYLELSSYFSKLLNSLPVSFSTYLSAHLLPWWAKSQNFFI